MVLHNSLCLLQGVSWCNFPLMATMYLSLCQNSFSPGTQRVRRRSHAVCQPLSVWHQISFFHTIKLSAAIYHSTTHWLRNIKMATFHICLIVCNCVIQSSTDLDCVAPLGGRQAFFHTHTHEHPTMIVVLHFVQCKITICLGCCLLRMPFTQFPEQQPNTKGRIAAFQMEVSGKGFLCMR